MAMNPHSMSQHYQHVPRVAHLEEEMVVDVYDEEDDLETELDEEVDQLDPDTEDETPAGHAKGGPATATGGKARQRRPAQRVAGQPAIPLERLETILDSEGASKSAFTSMLQVDWFTGMSNHMSKEAMFMLAAATVSAL